MEFSFKMTVNAEKENVWRYYEDLNLWPLWEEDLENISLPNGFVSGSRGFMKLKGMPEIEFRLTSVTKYKGFRDETDTPFGKLIFSHEITSEGGKTCVCHKVSLEKPQILQEDIDLLKGVFADVPKAVYKIAEHAGK